MREHSLQVIFILDAGFRGGGAERVASILASTWAETTFSVAVLSFLPPEDDVYRVTSSVSRTVLDMGGEKPRVPTGIRSQLRALIKTRRALCRMISDRPTVVVSFLTVPNVRTLLASRMLGVPVVVSERSDTTRQRHPLQWRLLRRLLYPRAALVTANSPVSIEDMKRYVPADRLRLVSNPVVVPDASAAVDRSPTIVSVGRFVPLKRYDLLIDAFAAVAPTHPDWRLTLVGDGPEYDRIRQHAVDAGVAERVQLPGRRNDVDRYYRNAAIYVLTSEYEGMPNALLEAMSWGLSCIVPSDIPGATLVVEHDATGIVFNRGEPDTLAAALTELMRDPDRRLRLGDGARRRVSDFAPDRVAAQWEQLVRAVAPAE